MDRGPAPDRETLEPGAQSVADRHGVSTGQLYTWRKQMLAMAMAGFAPVEVVPEPSEPALPVPATAPATTETMGSLEVVLPSGASIRGYGRRQCREAAHGAGRAGRPLMLGPPPGARVFLACGGTMPNGKHVKAQRLPALLRPFSLVWNEQIHDSNETVALASRPTPMFSARAMTAF